MSFNWLDYLNLAQDLAAKTEEAKLRSAISRAYYAAFIQVRNYLYQKPGLTISNRNIHQEVIKQFKESKDRVYQKIGKRLEHLRVYRNQADYDNTVTHLNDKTQEALILARRIISALDSL